MSFAVKAIDHVEVFVGDLEVAAKWYEDVLGLTEITRWDPEPLMIGAGATKLALFRRNSARAPSAGPLRISKGWRRGATWPINRLPGCVGDLHRKLFMCPLMREP